MKADPLRGDRLRRQLVGLLPRMRNFARSLTKDTDQADELVQSACERALKRFDQFREESRLDSWLYRIIHTRWIDTVRRRAARDTNLILLHRRTANGDAVDRADLRMAAMLDVEKAFDSLADEHRAAITLVCVEGFSYEEAAEVLNVAVGTVASRVARARVRLAEVLHGSRERQISPSLQRQRGKEDR